MAGRQKHAEQESQEINILDLLRGPADFQDVSLENYRVHYVCGEIDEFSAQEACEFLLKCYFMDKSKPVTLVINSPGGSCSEGFAIIDLMASLGLKVKTVALGQVCSMGFLLFVAGSPGERSVAPNCTFMSHQFYAGNEGKMHEIEAAKKKKKNLEERIVNHLIKHTGLTKKKVKDTLLPSHDVWLTAEEAIKLNIGDKILSNIEN